MCFCFSFFNTSGPVPVSLLLVVSCMCLLFGVASLRSSSPPLSSERSVTPCLLRAPRSPFSLYPFLAFQCSLVPLCLLIRGEQHSQPPPTVCLSSRCQHPSLPDYLANHATATGSIYTKWALVVKPVVLFFIHAKAIHIFDLLFIGKSSLCFNEANGDPNKLNKIKLKHLKWEGIFILTIIGAIKMN